MNDAVSAFGVVGLIILSLLAVILILFWIIFPWMVYNKLSGLIESQKRLEESQRATQQALTKIENHALMIAINTSRLTEFFEDKNVVVGAGQPPRDD